MPSRLLILPAPMLNRTTIKIERLVFENMSIAQSYHQHQIETLAGELILLIRFNWFDSIVCVDKTAKNVRKFQSLQIIYWFRWNISNRNVINSLCEIDSFPTANNLVWLFCVRFNFETYKNYFFFNHLFLLFVCFVKLRSLCNKSSTVNIEAVPLNWTDGKKKSNPSVGN